MTVKPLLVSKDNHTRLWKLKLDKGFSKLDDCISWLFEKVTDLSVRLEGLLSEVKRLREENRGLRK